MAAAFDLFGFAKGAEYAQDQNTQDEENALRQRRNEDDLASFEKQLADYDAGRPLRQELQQQTLKNAQLRGQVLTTKLQDDAEYQQIHDRALASLSPDVLNDASPLGGLHRVDALQSYMQANAVHPRHLARLVPALQEARGAALDRSQYDPGLVNELLRHKVFNNGQYQISEIPDKPGQFQVLQAIQYPADSNDRGGMVAYAPMPGRAGNLAAVMSTLRSQFSPRVNPDYGNSVLARDDNINTARAAALAKADLEAQKAIAAATQGRAGIAQRDTANKRTTTAHSESNRLRELQRGAMTQLTESKKVFRQLSDPKMGADVRAVRAAAAEVKAWEEKLRGYEEEFRATEEE